MEIPEEFRSLTDKQKNYARFKTHGMSQADAYRAAYNAQNMNSFQISGECARLNNHPKISRLIYFYQDQAAKKSTISKEWLISWHWMRATYDPDELTKIIIGACEHCHGENHAKQWRAPIYMEELRKAEMTKSPLPDIGGGFGYDHRRAPHPECPVCGGAGRLHTWFADTSELSESARAAFEGVEQTKDGLKVRMADKDKNMERVAKLMGLDVATLNVVANIPTAEERAAMTPEAIASAYKRLMEAG